MTGGEGKPEPGWLLRGVLVASGTLSVAIGLIGAFVPILPTTPFLLLAAACFLRSSARMYRWLHGNPLFGEYLRRYRDGEGFSPLFKAATLSLLWLSLGASLFLTAPARKPWVRAVLLTVGGLVTLHVLGLNGSRGKRVGARQQISVEDSPE